MLDDLKQALSATGIDFRAYAWSSAPKNKNYGVYSIEGSGGSVHGDGSMLYQAIEGTVDLFCRDDSLTDFNKVQTALNTACVAWSLNSVQFEESTKLVHYEWVFQVVNSIG